MTFTAGLDGTVVPGPRNPIDPITGRARGDGPRASRGWIKDPSSFVVAVLALIASIVALYFSQANHDRDQLSLDRQRLTALEDSVTQVLQATPDGQPVKAGTTRPYMNEAAILIKRLDGTPLEATPYERVRIAFLFRSANEPSTGIDLAAYAERQAQTLSLAERVDSAKELAADQFAAGRPEEGRSSYARALRYVDTGPTGHDTVSLAHTREEIEVVWADNEMRADDCDAAAEHVRAARARVDGMSKWGQIRFDDQAVDVAKRFVQTCGRSALNG